ncbi:MAG: SET domain-containing protein-lysine N-methyltransferase [Methylobacteriaceae bacterium]|nr:SET domain-containing protein-lysine N-methyltransferase [Methylobacteriaceae bacterium]
MQNSKNRIETDDFRGPVLGRTRVGRVANKGRGLIAAERIVAGEVIEQNLCLVLDLEEGRAIAATRLRHYVYLWEEAAAGDMLALAMGNLSFCNHSSRPNAKIELDKDRALVGLRAAQNIEAGAEVTIDYDYPLEFTVHE